MRTFYKLYCFILNHTGENMRNGGNFIGQSRIYRMPLLIITKVRSKEWREKEGKRAVVRKPSIYATGGGKRVQVNTNYQIRLA